ncbi:LytR/AlgR family response regulator transcription factor [Negadavirga shengliensis]|uniref:LytR/AlgR family response regulator transcription factor n=1 Tax=Negadavirga shengliensis TaxID=1389218 RepID=A0ABV9T2C0_9BACT
MIRCVAIDDEPLALQLIEEYLIDHPGVEVVGKYHDGFSGLKGISETKPDLIFLDIQMPKINGFEMLELVDNPPPVIFTTAFDEFAIKAFEIHAVDYLLKPFTKERLWEAVERVAKQTGSSIATGQKLLENRFVGEGQLERVVVKIAHHIHIVPVLDIHYFSSDGDYVSIHTAEKEYLKLSTMNFFENSLDPNDFVRIHRSYIVNVSEITKIESYQKDSQVVVLKNGKVLPVSKSGIGRLKAVLGI